MRRFTLPLGGFYDPVEQHSNVLFIVPAYFSDFFLYFLELGSRLFKSTSVDQALYEFKVVKNYVTVKYLLCDHLFDNKLSYHIEQSFEKVGVDLKYNSTNSRCDKFIEISTQSNSYSYTLFTVSAQFDFPQYLTETICHIFNVTFEVVLVFEELHMNSTHVSDQLNHLQFQLDRFAI